MGRCCTPTEAARGSTPAASTASCASGSGSPSRWAPPGSASTTVPPRPSSRRSSASSYTIAGSPPGPRPAGNHPLDRGLVQRPPAALVDRLPDPQRKGGRLAYRPSRRITHCPSDGSAPDGCGGHRRFSEPWVRSQDVRWVRRRSACWDGAQRAAVRREPPQGLAHPGIEGATRWLRSRSAGSARRAGRARRLLDSAARHLRGRARLLRAGGVTCLGRAPIDGHAWIAPSAGPRRSRW